MNTQEAIEIIKKLQHNGQYIINNSNEERMLRKALSHVFEENAESYLRRIKKNE